jgi:hypothetical protein
VLKHLLKATNLKPHQAHPNQLESISIQFKPDYYKNNNVSFHHVVALFHISIPIRSNSIQFKSVLILWRFNLGSTDNESTNYMEKVLFTTYSLQYYIYFHKLKRFLKLFLLLFSLIL